MPINHVVVLMLENRSFDHMLGFMKTQDWPINGLSGNESNYPDPQNPTGTPVPMRPKATYVPDLDPGPMHDYANVVRQIHGGTNAGFVADYLTITDAARAGHVMTGFAPDKLPVLATLAKEFAVCDNWFSSLPGPTWPNRFFVHCATAGGYVDGAPRNYPMRTLYENLRDAHVNWRIYYHDIPQSLALQNQRKFFHAQYEIYNQSFVRDCKQGRLPQYSFIEPRYFNEGSSRANDQHPIHGVVGGELLIADVYEAVRSSPNWNETVLIIIYDEHGGFYDHVPPPAATPPDPPNPDAPLTVPRPSTAGASALQAMPAATVPEKPNDLQNDLLALTRELGLPISLCHVQAMSRAATADEAFNESLAHFNAFVDRTAGKRQV